MRNAWVVVVGVLVSSRVWAQPTDGPAPKSESTALVLTMAGTALPSVGMIVGAQFADDLGDLEKVFVATTSGLAVLPAAGQWYAGRTGAFGLVVRTAGAAAMIGGYHLLIESKARDGRSVLLLGAGTTLVIGGIVYDAIFAPRAVRDWNRERSMQASVIKVAGGYGLGIAGAF